MRTYASLLTNHCQAPRCAAKGQLWRLPGGAVVACTKQHAATVDSLLRQQEQGRSTGAGAMNDAATDALRAVLAWLKDLWEAGDLPAGGDTLAELVATALEGEQTDA